MWKQKKLTKPTSFLPECAPLGCLRVMRGTKSAGFMVIGVALTVEAEGRFFAVAVGSAIRQLHQLKGLYPRYPDPSKAWRHFEDQNTPARFIHPKPLEGPIADP